MPKDSQGNYVPPAVSGYFPSDLFNASAPLSVNSGQSVQPRFSARVVERLPQGDVVFWQATIEDLRGGLNLTNGRFDEDFDRVESGDADARFYRTLILPQLTTNATSPDPGGTARGMHSVNFNNKLYIGIGSTANLALFSETSSSDPTIGAVTYSPSSGITALATVAAGGANAALRLAVGRNDAADPVQLLTTAHATTSMHANTGRCWGIIQTFINNNTILIYSQGAIRYLDSTTSDVATQPTVGLSNVPNGGYALGMVKLAGAPIRPYWVWPLNENTSGMLVPGSETPGRLVSTNQEGTDYQYIPMGLKYVFSACIVNGTALVATDKERIVYYDGKTTARDLGWVSARTPNSDRIYECRGLVANGPEIWCRVNHKAAPSGTGNTNAWWEVYNLETGAWHQVSASATMSSTGSYSTLPAGALPLSETTGFIHDYSDGSWRRLFVPLYGYNPYNTYRQTSDAQSGSGNEYEQNARITLPKLEFPGLEGWPKYVTRIIFHGDVESGGSDSVAASVQWSAGNMDATFNTGFENRAQLMNVLDNNDLFYRLQPVCNLTRTTASTRFTPNALPVTFEGYAFVGNAEPPYSWVEDVR